MNLTPLISLIMASTLSLFLTMQTSLAAGFHYQLDLTAKLVTNNENELTGIQMSWLYDKNLSFDLLNGQTAIDDKRKAEIVSGLAEVKYFTTLYLDKKPLETANVESHELSLAQESSSSDKPRLKLNLTLPLKESQPLKGHVLDIVVTDDSAIGLATFIDTSHMLLSDSAKAVCQAPQLVQQNLAEVDGHAQITETMTINCQ